MGENIILIERWLDNIKWANFYSNGKFVNTERDLEALKNKLK